MMKPKYILQITHILLLALQSLPAFSQSAGDYRSAASAEWNLATTWERFDGTSWVPAPAAPTSSDGLISILNTHTVTIQTIITADQIVVDAGGTLVLNSNLNLNDGVGDDLIIHGSFTFNTGNLGSNGSIRIVSTGTLQLVTGGLKFIHDPIVNDGTLAWLGGTIVPMANSGAALTNNNLFSISASDLYQDNGGTGTIINNGLITKSGGGTSTFNSFGLTNSGSIEISAGVLHFQTGSFTHTGTISLTGGGWSTGMAFHYQAGSVLTGSGTFSNTASGILHLNTDLTFPASIAFSNSGTIQGAGNLTVNTDFTIQGTLQGSGSLTVNANTTWTGGTLDRTFTNQPGRTLTCSTTGTKNLLAPLTNDGTMIWNDDGFIIPQVNQGASFTNNGTFTINGNSLFQDNGGTGTIINTGTVTKNSSGTTSFNNINFSNSGTLQWNGGTVSFAAGSLTNSGNITLSTANLSLMTTFHHNAGSVIQGNGNFTNGGTMNLNVDLVFPASIPFTNSGTVQGAGHLTVNNNFILQGTVQGAGTLTINGNTDWISGTLDRTFTNQPGRTLTCSTSGTKNLLAPLTNDGTMIWNDDGFIIPQVNQGASFTNNGTFTINGNSLFQDNGGTGTIINTGTVTKNSSGTTSFNNLNFTNSGVIQLNAGTTQFFTGTMTNSGLIQLASGNLTLSTTFHHNPGSVIQGTGSVSTTGILNLNIDLTTPATMPFSNSGTIQGNGHLVVNNNFVLQGIIQGAGNLTVNGNTDWISGTLDRTFTNQSGRTLTCSTISSKNLLAPLTNDGTMIWNDDGFIIPLANQGASFTNNGTFTINGNSLIQDNGGLGILTNHGIITKTSTGTTSINSINVVNTSTGVISGVGHYALSFFNNAGTISPGLSPGLMSMSKYSPGLSIDIEIAGPAGPGQVMGHDQLQITTLPVSLGGMLDITLINGYEPMPGDTFIVMTMPAGYTGSFSGASSCWQVLYRPTHVAVRYTPAVINLCPGDTTLNNIPGSCSAVLIYSVDTTGIPSPTFSHLFSGATNASGSGIGTGSVFNVGVTMVHVIADNGCSMDTCSFIVTVDDIEVPLITCPPNITLQNDPGQCTTVYPFSVMVSDNCAGATFQQISGLPSGSAFPKGVTVNSFVATDTSGNTSSCSFSVTVTDSELPSITCPAHISLPADPGMCSAIVSFAAPVFSDNCPGASVMQTSGLSSGSAFPVGVTQNTFVVTDADGLTQSCVQSITISDNQPPTVNCPANVTVNVDPGMCGNAFTYSISFTDNCPGAMIQQTAGLSSGSVFPTGITQNTFLVTDAAGNTSSCSFTITVIDNEPPVIQCPAHITSDNDPGICGRTVNYSVPFSDNCPGSLIMQTQGLVSGSVFPVGSTTNSFVVTDAAGLTATCSFIVTIQDTTPPAIICPPHITVSMDPGMCVASGVSLGIPATSDNCGVASTINNAPTLFHPGMTSVIWTVTDVNGLTSSCVQTVTVTDNQDPQINCPADITESANPGTCDRVVHFMATATDNCGVAGIVYVPASGSSFPVGTTVVTATVTDIHGRTSSCTFSVIINDNEDPVIQCPADLFQNTDSGQCTAVVSFAATATDNCAIDTITYNPVSGFAFPKGVTTVTATATDIHGNTSSCSFMITVTDAEDPVIDCPPDTIIIIPFGNPGTIVNYNVNGSDNCPGSSVMQIAGLSSGSFFPVDTTTNTFVITDAEGRTDTCSFDVIVIDSPIICPGDTTSSALAGQCQAPVSGLDPQINPPGQPYDYVMTGATTGSGNGSVSGFNFNVGTTQVTYTLTNMPSFFCSFTVTIHDVENPSILCPPDITSHNDPGQCGKTVTYNVSFSDNCPGVMIQQTTGLPTGSAFPVGSTINTFVATDASGNTMSCSFAVIISDITPPVITCPPHLTVSMDAGICTAFGVSLGTPVAVDNCAIDTVFHNGPVTYMQGTTDVVWTVTDVNGLMHTCIQMVTVVDTEDPVILCPADTTLSASSGMCQRNVNFTASASDNCGIANVVYLPASGSAFPVGSTIVTATVTDVNGRTATCTFTVIITDDEDPTINCPPDILQATDPGQCDAVVVYTAIANDNCAVDTIIFTPASGSVFPPGTTMVTATVTDIHGHTDSCTFQVTVEDQENPGIQCPNDTLMVIPFGQTGDTVFYSVTASDNCPGVMVSQIAGLPSGSFFPIDTTTNTFVVTDGAGLTDTCSFDIIIIDTPIICPDDTTETAQTGVCHAIVNGLNPQLNPPGQPVEYTLSGSTSGMGSGSVSGLSFNVGVTTVTYTLTNMPSLSCDFTVTVMDTEAPQINCPANINAGTDPGQCGKTIIYSVPYSDNCPGAILQQTMGLSSGSLFPVGTTYCAFIVTDAAGHTATCSFSVTITDTEVPSIVCPSHLALPASPGLCAATGVMLGNPVTSDNCSIVSVSNNAPSSFPVGITQVVWIVMDVNGLTASCTQSVTVTDNQPPSISCSPNIVAFADPVTQTAVVTYPSPAFSDNCPGASMMQTAGLPSGSSFPLGTTINTFVVTDANGMTASCSFSVSVRVGKVGINTTTPQAILHVSDSSVLMTGALPLPVSPASPPLSGSGVRMMWYPQKAALRSGYVNGNEWSRDSIGKYSLAIGQNVKATKDASGAFGIGTTASGLASISMGNAVKATGTHTASFGNASMATGNQSTALGSSPQASGQASLALSNGTASGQRSLAGGNTSTASGQNAISFGNTNTGTGQNTAVFGSMLSMGTYLGFLSGFDFAPSFTHSATWSDLDPLWVVANDGVAALHMAKNGHTGLSATTGAYKLGVYSSQGGNGSHTQGIGIESINASVGEAAINYTNSLIPDDRRWSIGLNQTPLLAMNYGPFFSATYTRMVLDTAGQLGINTNTPQASLHIQRNNPSNGLMNSALLAAFESNFNSYLQLSALTAQGFGILSGNQLTHTRSSLLFSADSTLQLSAGGAVTRLHISKTGDVGLGTTVPLARLDVPSVLILGVNGSTVSQVVKASHTADLPSIAAGATYLLTVPISNLSVGSIAYVSPGGVLPDGLIIASAIVPTTNTLEIRFVNDAAVAVNPANMTYYIAIIR